jgi:hypothetical protein
MKATRNLEDDRLLSEFQAVDEGSGDQSSINYVARIKKLENNLRVL